MFGGMSWHPKGHPLRSCTPKQEDSHKETPPDGVMALWGPPRVQQPGQNRNAILAVTVEDGCCPFKIVFDEDLYIVFDEDIYVLSMYCALL